MYTTYFHVKLVLIADKRHPCASSLRTSVAVLNSEYQRQKRLAVNLYKPCAQRHNDNNGHYHSRAGPHQPWRYLSNYVAHLFAPQFQIVVLIHGESNGINLLLVIHKIILAACCGIVCPLQGKPFRFVAFRRLLLTVFTYFRQICKRLPSTMQKAIFQKAKSHVWESEKAPFETATTTCH